MIRMFKKFLPFIIGFVAGAMAGQPLVAKLKEITTKKPTV